jgi:hypothetical protein
MFRERFISASDLVKNARNPPNDYVVVRFRAGDLFQLGLSLNATYDDEDLPGHVVIPELNCSNSESKRQECKEIYLRLAKLAQLNVVADFP